MQQEIKLHAHQETAMERLRASVAGGCRRVVLQAPTGMGKTVVAASVVQRALQKDKKVIFTVPAISLIDQTIEQFWKAGISDIGVIQSKHEMTNSRATVQIASVQTLMRRPIPRADVVLIDEVHRLFDFYRRWLADPEWGDVPFIGLSATPWTKGLGKLFDQLIIASTTQELIDLGFLSPFKAFAPSHPDLKGVRTLAGDYHEGDLATAVNKPQLIAEVVDTWLKIAEDRQTFVFAVDRAHAQRLSEQFSEYGISTGYIDYMTDMGEREEVRKKFHNGDIRVVCNVGCLTTGVDWDVRCIVLARPTKSEMLYVQMVGRGLRTADGKSDCLILDHSNTTEKLGFVTDIHHEELNSGKPNKTAVAKPTEERLPKLCPKCSFLKPPSVHTCPSCGFTPKKQSVVKTGRGELKEISPKKRHLQKINGAELHGMLLCVANSRGFARGWASHKFKEIRGVFPVWGADIKEVEPTPELLNWIKSRDIAFINMKKKDLAAARAKHNLI